MLFGWLLLCGFKVIELQVKETITKEGWLVFLAHKNKVFQARQAANNSRFFASCLTWQQCPFLLCKSDNITEQFEHEFRSKTQIEPLPLRRWGDAFLEGGRLCIVWSDKHTPTISTLPPTTIIHVSAIPIYSPTYHPQIPLLSTKTTRSIPL